MATTDELLDALMRNCKKPQDLLGNNGLLNQLSGKSQEQVIPIKMTGHPESVDSSRKIKR